MPYKNERNTCQASYEWLCIIFELLNELFSIKFFEFKCLNDFIERIQKSSDKYIEQFIVLFGKIDVIFKYSKRHSHWIPFNFIYLGIWLVLVAWNFVHIYSFVYL